MSKNQEYIARIRYQNDLPPPLLPPKLLNYNIKTAEEIGSASLLTNLYRKENVNNLLQINDDLGLPIDLILKPEVFNSTDDSKSGSDHPKLHPKDQVLLRDPGVDRIAKSQPNVSFLRRTEYIGSAKSQQQLSRSVTPAVEESSKVDPSSLAGQLHSIEATFENATKTLDDPSTLRHPLKKNLKARKVWSVLPDISRMDQLFSSVRVSTRQGDDDQGWLNKAIFRQLTLDKNENLNWLSIYTLNDEENKEKKFLKKINELNENLPNEQKEEDLEERFRFLKQGDYEMKPQRLDNTPVSSTNTQFIPETTEIKEIAIRFDDENNIVYYNPIHLKTELKKRKLQEHYQDTFDELNIDELNLKVREPTVEELNKRNNKRHKHDDITYESTEPVKDEDEDDLEEIRQNNFD